VFSCILENAPKNRAEGDVMQKIEQNGGGGETCVLRKWFTKKFGVNHFSNFNKGFSGQ
jgi:hypothetical protein